MAIPSVVSRPAEFTENNSGAWSRVKQWVRRYVEEMFVVTVFVGTLMIFFFAPYKLTFLNFFYLPIFAVGYFVGFRKALTGSVFCFLLVCLSALFQPEAFTTTSGGRQDALFNITSWGIFLVLAGAFSGLFQERLHKQYRRISRLNRELSRERGILGRFPSQTDASERSTLSGIGATSSEESGHGKPKREIGNHAAHDDGPRCGAKDDTRGYQFGETGSFRSVSWI